MTQTCKTEVEAHMKLTHSEFYLNPRLAKHCVKDEQCKQALKPKIRQRVQNVRLDPKARGACAADVDRWCADAKRAGKAAVQKCLQEDPSRLSDACREKQT